MLTSFASYIVIIISVISLSVVLVANSVKGHAVGCKECK